MTSKTSSSAAQFLILNLLVSALLVSQCDTAFTIPTLPTAPPAQGGDGACPRDALKFGVCANVLSKLLGVTVGSPPKEPCCPLILGLLDLEVPVCLCTAIKANILGINVINIPIALSLLVDYCGSKVPTGFQCA